MTVSRAASFSATVLPLSHSESSLPLRGLTTALARGEDAAWAQFHREYGPRIFRQLLTATRGDHALASDALQQTYLRVARHARPCDSEVMFVSWLRTVAQSALCDCTRRRRSFFNLISRRKADPSDQTDYVESTSGDADESRLLAALDAALSQLTEDERVLLEAKYFSAASVRDLAEKLSASPKAIESRLTRARAELRRHLLEQLSRHEA